MPSPLTDDEPPCSIERALRIIGERWTLLILRQIFGGQHRFAELRDALGIAPNLLSARLHGLVDAGVLETREYQEPGARARQSYHLTESGRQLRIVLAALQQWGDENCPRAAGPSMLRRSHSTGRPLHLALVDDAGAEVPLTDAEFVRAPDPQPAGPAPIGPGLVRRR